MPKLHAGLDVSDKSTSICVVDDDGVIVLEAVAETSPASIRAVLKPFGRSLKTVGLESGSRGVQLYKGLTRAKLPVVCMDAFHAHSVLSTKLNKTDANDARGLAFLLAKGIFRHAYVKSDYAYRLRVMLTLREVLQAKAQSIQRAEQNARKLLAFKEVHKPKRGPTPKQSDVDRLVQTALKCCVDGVDGLMRQHDALDKVVREIARDDQVCQRLMTIPGVGPITALTFIAVLDDPFRFTSSRMVAAYLGLTPRVFQSGNVTRSGGISHRGDVIARKALFIAARSLLSKARTDCALRRWGLRLADAKGRMVANVACARKLAVLMHHLWVTGQDFDPAR